MTTKQTTRRSSPRKAKKPEGRPQHMWRLPSGKRLAEFALASGFLAPPLMENQRELGRGERKAS